MIKNYLDEVDGSLDNIDLDTTLDSISYTEKYDILSKIIAKLRKGGEITITGLDINLFTNLVKNDSIDLLKINEILGSVNSVDSMLQVEKFLIERGLKLVKRRILNDGKYFLSAKY